MNEQINEANNILDNHKNDFNVFKDCLFKSKSNINSWLTDNKYQNNKINSLKSDLVKFDQYLEKECSTKKKYLWNTIYIWVAKNLREECWMVKNSFLRETYDRLTRNLRFLYIF